ncbi:MAG: DUF1801 domain-containing protein [Candidatus Dormibacteraeota bacterium]|nr:DUF1801 domain-containing protein [Candidatus Dormibacteraeota bacterium]
MVKSRAQDVDGYIAEAPAAVQPMLRQLRQLIKSAAPKAEERLSYGMPFYKYRGRLIYFAAHKTHVGVYPVGRAKTVYAKELKPYLAEKETLRFPIGKRLPVTLIKKVVTERVKENERSG